jgi:hypothetical protein
MPIGFDLQSQLIADAELKYLAQKSFISYLRSVHLKADKQVNRALPRLHEAGRLTGRVDQPASLRASQIFDVQALSAHAKVYSESLGLLEPPKVLKASLRSPEAHSHPNPIWKAIRFHAHCGTSSSARCKQNRMQLNGRCAAACHFHSIGA